MFLQKWRLGLLLFLGIGSLSAEKLEVSVESEAAILINVTNGAILYEKNAHTLNYPASITKIATTLYALEQKGHHLSEIVSADAESIASISEQAKKKSNYTTPSHWIEYASTHIGIKKGENFTLKELLYGIMVASANDAANVVAQHVAGSVPVFMKGLNGFIKSLGCENTYFTNPHGLHHPKHQTTPYDMALLTREAMKNPIFRELAAAPKFIRPKTNKQESVVILQKNRLLRRGEYYYPQAIGVKTGYTSIARHTLVAAAKRDGRELLAVLMKCKEGGQIYRDAIHLFEAAFNEKQEEMIILEKGPQKYLHSLKGADKPLKTFIKSSLSLKYYPAEKPVVKCYLQWHSLKLPIVKGQQVGEVYLQDRNGQQLQKVALYAEQGVQQTWIGWLKSLFKITKE
ncbi:MULTISPECIES: D-alanyl-D-alanine carboxypeptidase family protein [unclassified Neochlamydia]|uniref:D-alanyl-D-alanine carboxypeptidase family protein n=1 Tax=unclassified Neochlamydia TaxID=2643326 RepID=UPI00140997E2|nr:MULTISPECIES: D-alanyl-D-alanine carboxypeptidase family protein [unclassified Neochlamydia]MBS4169512.1 D-alanyl-D-alanine carboxypeptidase DacB [Neochlamydia sp. AcF95]NGY95469.1 D-alanyl-D-alanine carboxypeptidase DacB [Neochlamydia sp. AcF84]